MPGLARRMIVLSTAVFAATAVLPGRADARTLFEALFGGPIQRVEPVEPAPPQAPRVATPVYYTYKADPLVRVDFRKLVAQAEARQQAAADAATHSITVASAELQESPDVARLDDASTGEGTTAGPTVPAEGIDAATPSGADDPNPFIEAVADLTEYDLYAEKDIAAALVEHYQAEPSFIWVGDELAPNARAERAMSVLADAAAEGLRAEDYEIASPDLTVLDDEARLAALAQFEMALSAKVLRYVRDAWRGRVDPNRISEYYDFAPEPIDYNEVMSRLRSETSGLGVGDYLLSWHPAMPEYAALKRELASLRATQDDAIVIAPDTFIRPGATNTEFPKILKLIERDADSAFLSRFGPQLIVASGTQTYSEDLVPLIKAAQKAKGLSPDGVIGPRTIAAYVADTKADKIQKVLVAMEQIRWLPSTLGARHVFINVPEFRASYHENGEDKLSMKVVVGLKSTQTYFFQDEIEYVEFHPYWGIPRTIFVNQYLPKLYADPSYLDRIGYEVTDVKGRKIPSSAIDWPAYGAQIPFDIRQPPGPRNALGEMKIMFPNKHAIYMHDTPHKELFAKERRAYSNGCVRLEDPRGMAAAVLGWTREQVAERVKGPHGQVDLAEKVPVYVGYFTAWPHADGQVVYSADVYGRDTYLRRALEKVEEVRAPSA